MDVSAIIVVVVGSGLFFAFIVWMAVYSRRKNQENLLLERPEINFSEARKMNKQHLEE